MGGSGCTNCGSLFHPRARCGALRPAAPIAPLTQLKHAQRKEEIHSKVSPHQFTKLFRSGEVRVVEPTPLYTLEEAERILAIQAPQRRPNRWTGKNAPRTWGTKRLPSGMTNRSWI